MLKTHRENQPLKNLWAKLVLVITMLSLAACGQQEEPVDFDILSSAPENQEELAFQTRFRTFDAIWDTVDEHYVYANSSEIDLGAIEAEFRNRITGATDQESFQGIIKEMFTFFPEDTVLWQTREERIQREVNSISASSSLGIGSFTIFRPDPEPHIVLIAVITNSPADAAGLQPRDSIYALDGRPFAPDATPSQVAELLRGPGGSTITLSVQSPGEERREVELTRTPIQVSSNRVQARFHEDDNILTIIFPRFGYPDMDTDFLTMFQAFDENEAIEGIIFDLRIATTGAEWPIDQLLSLFIQGEIGTSFSNSESNPIVIQPQDFNNTQAMPVAVLIGPETQGIPELFATGLQTTGRALVYGLPSAGNLEAVIAFPMPDGSQLAITTASFLTPEGVDIGMNGVTPDVPLNILWETQHPEDDEVVNAAIDDLRDIGN